MITTGTKVRWTYANWDWRKRHKACAPIAYTARVISVGCNTAKIEYRRNDGKIATRYIKLSRLYV